METILEKNIRALLSAKNLSVAELSRLSEVPYRTLQDILALKQAAKITTVAAIAAGLGVSPGKLLEQPPGMEAEPQPPSKEELLIAIFQGSLKLSDSQLRVILDQIEIAIEGVNEDDFLDSSDDVKSGS